VQLVWIKYVLQTRFSSIPLANRNVETKRHFDFKVEFAGMATIYFNYLHVCCSVKTMFNNH